MPSLLLRASFRASYNDRPFFKTKSSLLSYLCIFNRTVKGLHHETGWVFDVVLGHRPVSKTVEMSEKSSKTQ